ncbi:U2 small nuclear ribonucleoprotein 40k Da [Trypanosoma conorhini]|uniref:U2 small nuclear ribonucleoprotein 40k Da n=1 Tax=Trypanosoma conorhini TaxID=83891 RepID=A0A3R7PV09_9TRYP|nr:U2 small nuclear ribonucleoprotein 40k Da [Trypanosoma conorhini]RNF25589.1 U2 small nuclear ribonucleoprotein 40k Da [Trypanosoma conorhini]
MRLTVDIIRRAPQFTNTLLQREIDLRGLGLTVLDERSLQQLNDSFDVLNLSQNPLVRLDYFPSGIGTGTASQAGATTSVDPGQRMMLRLQSLVVHRNRLSHVSEATCAALLPNIRAFLADHNEFRELRDLLFLSHWRQLEILSIEHNPVAQHESEARLRAFVVFLCPKLKLVNYQRVTQADRLNVEMMRGEFEQCVKEWRCLGEQSRVVRSGGVESAGEAAVINGDGLVNGKRLRKRGREAREAAAAAAAASTFSSGDGFGEVASAAVGPSTAATTVAASDATHEALDSTHARLEALEAKMAAAETEDELLEIQQEIMDLEAAAKQQQQQQQQGTKSKRARTS